MKRETEDRITKYVAGLFFIVFASILVYKESHGWAVLLLGLLIPLLKLDRLTELAISLKDGIQAKFQHDEEKLKEDIRDNKEAVTRQTFLSFKGVEEKVLTSLQRRYGGEMKTLVHFVYGSPEKPEFRYTPDGSIQTDDALYFFEIKYVKNKALAPTIVKNTLAYLQTVYDRLKSSVGKRLVIQLVIASHDDIDVHQFAVPEGVELEFFKLH